MKKFLIAVGVLGMLMTIVSLVIAIRFTYDPPPFEGLPFAITLTADQAKAELDRIAGLQDQQTKASLGRMASAAQSCVEGSLSKRPSDAVLQAARRFFLIVYAMRNRVQSPLIDPRTEDIPFSGPPSVEALMVTWRGQGESKATIDRWRWILSHYAQPDHPIYTGIGIAPGSWENQDLDNLFVAVKVAGKTFNDCVKGRV